MDAYLLPRSIRRKTKKLDYHQGDDPCDAASLKRLNRLLDDREGSLLHHWKVRIVLKLMYNVHGGRIRGRYPYSASQNLKKKQALRIWFSP